MRILWFLAGLALAIMYLAPADQAGAAASRPVSARAEKPKSATTISEPVARDIAWRFGILRVEEITLTGPFWHIAGRDEDGNDLVLDVDAHDGRILN